MADEYVCPGSVTQALEWLDDHGESLLLAGGTDVVPMLNGRNRKRPERIVYLGGIAELKQITERAGYLVVGALVTHTEIAGCAMLQERAPNVWRASLLMGTPAIRNTGTIGGNIVNASPAGDSCVALMAADARLAIQSRREHKEIGVDGFFTGRGATVLQAGEILCGIMLPQPGPGRKKGSSYQRISLLKGSSAAILNAAVEVETDADGVCCACRISMGAVAPKPVRLLPAEALAVGHKPDDKWADAVAQAIEPSLYPIDDAYATAWYRRKVAKVLVGRALREACGLPDGRD